MAAETLSVQVNGNFYATLQQVNVNNTVVDSFVQPLAMTLINGVGTGAANQIFGGQFTVAASSANIYNLVTFNGSVDGCGNPYNNATVKALFVQNINGTSTNGISVSGAACGANGWTTFSTGTAVLNGDSGYLFAVSPGPNGWACPPGSEHLQIYNPTGVPILYNMIVVGATRAF